MFRPLAAACFVATLAGAARADTFPVTVKAVDEAGKPVAKADAALFWRVTGGKMAPANAAAVTGADGTAALRVDDWNEKRPVLVLSADRTLGGYAAVSRADRNKTVTVVLGPTVTVKGKLDSKELGHAPPWANTTVTRKGFRAFNLESFGKEAAFAFTLPEGEYKLNSYGEEVTGKDTPLELAADRSEHDLGTIDLPADAVSKLKGRPAPAWLFADARGVDRNVTPADLKGKWVLVEFWGHWCGPCVAGALPELIGLYDDHAEHRDKFVILAVHDGGQFRTLSQVDAKLPAIKERHWRGRDLPFPVLLDKGRHTEKLFGVKHWPFGVLIDPAGNVVGPAEAADLEAKLPPVGAAKKWARHRDMAKNVYWTFGPKTDTLDSLAKTFGGWGGNVPVELDAAAAAAAGLSPKGPLPGVLVGSPLTLADIEAHLLAPHGLAVAPAADGKTLRVTARPKDAAPPPADGPRTAAVAARLDRKSGLADALRKPLALTAVPLADLPAVLAREFDVPFALDALAVHSRKLDPAATVTGAVGPADLRGGLTKLVAPLGLTVEVRHGAAVVSPVRR